VKTGKGYALRWFTPKVEVDLCGHATLATAFVLSLDPDTAAGTYHFQTNSGELTVTQERDWFTLDFPARPLETPDNTDALVSKVADICGARPVNLATSAGNCLAELENEAIVRSITPEPARVMTLDFKGLIVTARGADCDFVSRFFAPRVGINEDPVTGSLLQPDSLLASHYRQARIYRQAGLGPRRRPALPLRRGTGRHERTGGVV